MATTTYSTKLRLAIPTTGELADTWGNLINTGLTALVDDAIAGIATVTHPDTANYTLTANNAASDEARCAVLKITGALTAARNVVCPTQPKLYIIENATTGGFAVTLKTSAGTGIAVPNGATFTLRCDGTNVVAIRNTNSEFNAAVGDGALFSNTSGYHNVGIGYYAAWQITTGLRNIAIGADALSANVSGNNNIAVGKGALQFNTVSGNTAVGQQALYANTTGTNNTGFGYTAAVANTTGTNNSAFGYQALNANIDGNSNMAVGSLALYTGTSLDGCTAVGSEALYTTTGDNNTAIGWRAGQLCTTGHDNTAIGYKALQALTTGSGNVGIGPQDSAGNHAPVFNVTTENNRISMGSTAVTNAYVQVAWTVVSDARDKTDFAPVPHGLDFVCAMKPTAYRYKTKRDDTEGHGPVRYGFMAQDVLALEGASPVIVDADDPNKLRFNDQALLAVLVNAIQELRAEVRALQQK